MSKFSAKKFLPVLFLLFAIIGIIATGYAVNTGLFSLTRANPTYAPLQVEITNITDKSFTISWTTLAPTDGFVTYTDNNDTQFIARDVRDIIDQPLQSTTHWVDIWINSRTNLSIYHQ